MSNDYVKVKKRPLVDCLTCSLCSNLYREATTIGFCLHTFCKQCIHQKFEENTKSCCPLCKAYLGSFPKTLLRPDHNLRELVTQMLPFGNSASREGRSVSFPVNITTHENSRSNAPGVNGLPWDFGMSQNPKEHLNLNLNLTPLKSSNYLSTAFEKQHLNLNPTPLKSSNYLSTAFEKQRLFQMELPQVAPVISEPMFHVHSLNKVSKGPSQNSLAWHLEAEHRTVEKQKARQNSLMKFKMKRKTRRKSFLGKKHGDGKIRRRKRISILGSDDVEEHPDGSSHPVWFCLLACKEKRGTELPQIPKPYIRINNGDFAVSFVNKYLVQKLNLKDESEVEVMCCGNPLIPTLTLKNLVDIWVQATSSMGLMYINDNEEKEQQKKCNEEKADGKNFVMVLTYRRSKKHRTLR